INTAAEDEKDHTKITFEKNLFEAFMEGLAANKSMFSKEEIETLPWGAVLMPFLHGIRALTDYLNGNIYYKVAYENQNLDRCLSLYDFTRKALDEVAYMEETVLKKMA
ncbi:MAG: aminoglycoside phosphotransferase family protein, partial [Pricia sp.]